MSFIIRDLAAADRAQWQTLWDGYIAFYEAQVAPEVSDLTFARLLDAGEPMFCLVAEDATPDLLGLVQCVVHRSTWTAENYCYLGDLFTASAARGRGVGRALIEVVYARADAAGWARVHWLTHETNATARKLYDQLADNKGFIQYGRK